MGAFTRFSFDEDVLILECYWDSSQRREVEAQLADRHTAKSTQFRYYQLLKRLRLGSAKQFSRMMELRRQQGQGLPEQAIQQLRQIHENPPTQGRKPAKDRAPATGAMPGADRGKQDAILDLPEPSEEAKGNPVAQAPPAPPALEEPAAKAPAPAASSKEEVRILYADEIEPLLKRLDERMESLEQRVCSIQKGTGPDGHAFADFLEAMGKAYRFSHRLDELETILEENKQLRERLTELESFYNELDQMFGYYIRLASVKKVASLGDFVEGIGTIIDKFGQVLGVSSQEGIRRQLARLRKEKDSFSA